MEEAVLDLMGFTGPADAAVDVVVPVDPAMNLDLVLRRAGVECGSCRCGGTKSICSILTERDRSLHQGLLLFQDGRLLSLSHIFVHGDVSMEILDLV